MFFMHESFILSFLSNKILKNVYCQISIRLGRSVLLLWYEGLNKPRSVLFVCLSSVVNTWKKYCSIDCIASMIIERKGNTFKKPQTSNPWINDSH